MAYWAHTVDPIGSFEEVEFGNTFEYSINPQVVFAPPAHGGSRVAYPHRVWVGGLVNDQGWRAARVLGSVVHIIVDEDELGLPVVQKWQIRRHRRYGFGDGRALLASLA